MPTFSLKCVGHYHSIIQSTRSSIFDFQQQNYSITAVQYPARPYTSSELLANIKCPRNLHHSIRSFRFRNEKDGSIFLIREHLQNTLDRMICLPSHNMDELATCAFLGLLLSLGEMLMLSTSQQI
ncbi:hypothetical protein RB195_008757 [Necator americanus]|uniref:Uncharacterized protein n=1 Tax=Necator americanus TaxID=51031 RepID=A0ABR1CTI7_NECAM